jgi:hypothetical protein
MTITGSRTHSTTQMRCERSRAYHLLTFSFIRRRFEQNVGNAKNRAKNSFNAQNVVKCGPFHSAGISSCVYTAIRYTGRSRVFANRF